MKKYLALLMAILFLLCGIAFAEDTPAADIAVKEYEYINGVKCKKRQNLMTCLFMGIDQYGEVHERKDEDDIPGQCDVLFLLVIDQAADTYAIIMIDRNTVTGVHAISDYDGSDLGVFPMQLALAHTNGNGLEESCEVCVTAVSDLFKGIEIHRYAAANMDVIQLLNRSVGGVTVTLEEDFPFAEGTVKAGETVTLTDTQAESFIRGRMSVGDGTNAGRMRRQQIYLEAFRPLFNEKYRADVSFPLSLAHSFAPYMVTNMSDKDYSYIAKALLNNEFLGVYSLAGVTTIDSNSWEAFTPEESSIYDILITLFYKQV